MPEKPGAIIAVCIEVGSPEMLEDWLREGWMPNLDRLRSAGAWSFQMLPSHSQVSASPMAITRAPTPS